MGKTYSEITKATGIPKSTLSYWFKSLQIPDESIELLRKKELLTRRQAQEKAVIANRNQRGKYLLQIRKEYRNLKVKIKQKDYALIALTMLYLGEGSKTNKGYLTLGNSNPEVIKLFIRLLRQNFTIKEHKFRCTVQCRADQDIRLLEQFWSEVTNIPPKQFYKTRIDPRTINKPSRKLDYKGVCRLEYLCADVYNRISVIMNIITGR